MFLNIPKGDIGAAKASTIANKWNTYDEAENELSKLGFKIPAPPKGDVPAVRADLLENVQSPEYTTRYAELVSWVSFGETMRGAYEAKRLQYRTALRVTAAEIRRKAKETNDAGKGSRGWKPLTPADLQALLLVDVHYQDLLLLDQKITQRIEILTGFMKGISRAVALMSRNIELKKIDIEGQRALQSNRMAGVQPPVRSPARRIPVLSPHEEYRAPHEEPLDEPDIDE